MLKLLIVVCAIFLLTGFFAGKKNVVKAANPYLPLWEHIPDAEPYVFEDPDNPGKYRVYIYGSHDTRRHNYCGYDIVVWSAPVEDLNNWRNDGIVFQSIVDGKADVLFAPDVVEVVESDGTKTYYLYPNNQAYGRNTQVAKSKRPDGPFEVCNWKPGSETETVGIMGFDPAVLADDDGRAYGYWGFQRSFAAELDPETMYSIKSGTNVIEDLIGSCNAEDGNDFRYFEAPSIRKIEGKYVLVYSRVTKNGEYGLGESNATLAYAYADNPLGPWTYGGTIIDARGPEIGEDGKMIVTNPSHNTHGGLFEVDGQWYISYHRSINNDGFSRQATVEPVRLEVTETGELIITGTRNIEDESGNVYTGAEVTSQGFEINGLNPYKYHSAGITSFLLGGPYVKAVYDTWRDEAPVVNIRNNSIVGFKYFNFSSQPETGQSNQLEVYITPKGNAGTIEVMLDSPWEKRGGIKLGSLSFTSDLEQKLTKLVFPVPAPDEIEGKRALFFIFNTESSDELCEFNGFKFSKIEISTEKAFVAELDEWDKENLIPPVLRVYVDGKPVEEFELSDYDYNVFQYSYKLPAGNTEIPQVTAETDNDRIRVDIQQAETPSGTAVVSFSKVDSVKTYPVKKYLIKFSGEEE